MIIKVTKSMIEKGKRRHNTACPVALALMETKMFESVWIGIITTGLYYIDGRAVRCFTPYGLREAIREYDKKGQMIPFEFELERLIKQ